MLGTIIVCGFQVGLPPSMVRRIMKLGEETRNISKEALVIVVKAR